VVGDSVVLQTDLDEALLEAAAMGQPLPQDSAGLAAARLELLNASIDQLLLLQAAERDSVVIPDAAVDAQVEQMVEQQRQRLGGQIAFEEALRRDGLTL